jgi:hypothetical protein
MHLLVVFLIGNHKCMDMNNLKLSKSILTKTGNVHVT